MAAFVMNQNFPEALGKGVHNFTTSGSTFQLKIALCSAIDNANGALAGQTQCTGGGYAAKNVPGTVTYTETNGTGTMANGGTDLVFTASGGTISSVRYAVLYDDTPTSPVTDPVIGYWDYKSSQNVEDTETFTINFGASLFTIASA